MNLTILQGDANEQLKTLSSGSVHCCVTSPPYWGLRDYGVAGQLGLEKTPAEYVDKMVEVFREVWRVLRDDGTCWINLGDSYAGNNSSSGDREKRVLSGPKFHGGTSHIEQRRTVGCHGLKPKDLVGIPWMVAFALRADGWYLRQDIIWHKPQCMPESVSDRCTKAHEYIFLLSKSERYCFDQEAILEPCSPGTHARVSQNVAAQVGSGRANGGAKTNGNMKAAVRKPSGWHNSDRYEGQWLGKPGVNPKCAEAGSGIKQNESFAAGTCLVLPNRNKRSVWTVPTYSYSDAHFATYPPDLIKPCILAGCPVGGIVLDPFGGSGTTGMVALELGRRAILIELNPEYIQLIRQRCDVTPGLALA